MLGKPEREINLELIRAERDRWSFLPLRYTRFTLNHFHERENEIRDSAGRV